MQQIIDSFLNNIETLESSFNNNLENLVKGLSGLSDTQLLNAIGQLNLFDELIEGGFGDALNNLENGYNQMLQDAINLANQRGVIVSLGAGLQGLETLKDLQTAELLGRARNHSETLTRLLFQNLYAGTSQKEIIEQLRGTKLKDYQLNTLVDTSIRTFDDSARYKVFEGQDVKFEYLGPLDGKTRPECRETLLNQKSNFSDGFTEKQVLSSKTPFGLRGGFNCRHQWTVKA